MVSACAEGFLWAYEAFQFQVRILRWVCEKDDCGIVVGIGNLGF